MFSKKNLYFFILFSVIILIVIDRYNWAAVAQWREDQSVNLWLGYIQNPLKMPVGLISSVNFPNPNGMPLFAVLLSRLPDLRIVSTVLGLIQALLILWIAWLLFGRNSLFFLFSLPALASVVLRATSVEYWNNWVFTSVNLLFWGMWISYLRRPSMWKLPLFFLPMLFAPSLYLAGLVNAILYFVFMLIAIKIAPPQGNRKMIIFTILVVVIMIGLSLWLTWIPYYQTIKGIGLPVVPLTFSNLLPRLTQFIQSGVRFPVWNLFGWTKLAGNAFLQNSPQILSLFSKQSLRLTRLIMFLQASILLVVLLILFVKWIRNFHIKVQFFNEGYEFQGRVLLAGVGFVILAYMFSPLLGGPVWANGERIDQQVQFLPFLLFAWFTLPALVKFPKLIKKFADVLLPLIAAVFILISAVSGIKVIQDHLGYRGEFLSDADVPLSNKIQVVDFIAHDWMSISKNKMVPVSYDLGGGSNKWDWITEFGKQMEMWYSAPMTIGRGFDYELFRVYGLSNSQEGIQERSMNSSRYIVSYDFLPAPTLTNKNSRDYHIGRLRVTVVDQ